MAADVALKTRPTRQVKGGNDRNCCRIVATGTPTDLASNHASLTGRYL